MRLSPTRYTNKVGCLVGQTHPFSPLFRLGFFAPSFTQPDVQNNMVRKTHSKTALCEPENAQMLTDKDQEAKEHGHSTDAASDAEDPLRKKVLYLLIITSSIC
jgi:hypothetical protein